MKPQQSFKEHLASSLRELLTIRILALPIGALLVFVMIDHANAIALYWLLLKSPIAWMVWILGSITDAVIRAAYWYARERNPSYIKKQEAYERWKSEKAEKQASTDSPDKSDETSADQVR